MKVKRLLNLQKSHGGKVRQQAKLVALVGKLPDPVMAYSHY
jgi:hypothetical protein